MKQSNNNATNLAITPSDGKKKHCRIIKLSRCNYTEHNYNTAIAGIKDTSNTFVQEMVLTKLTFDEKFKSSMHLKS